MLKEDRATPSEATVAVIGMGCRFAGDVDSPESFWDLLSNGRDGIGEAPEERWAHYRDRGPEFAAALRKGTRHGAYLRDIAGFDAEFFGITPREAELMDPQQRVLLEVAWSALEHAGIPPIGLAGGDTGVFVGVGSDDYGRRMLEDLPRIEAWTGIGAAMCAAANRISYALDLRGPSLAVDTACSASLVAVHLACQSLRLGESSVAIAAGVNLIAAPGLALTLDAAGATSPDGRCKSFDATADGYGRGEGAGAVVLKRLADAQRDGDRVLALIRGSAVQQDGHTNGIMAPSGQAQQYLLARACRQAGIEPASVDYVEAHGTGTRLGDPLEAGALSAVYGAGRSPDDPCLIGSVKASIGHLEAGAGIASLIKAVLGLERGEIPASLNFREPNPAIDWTGGGIKVVAEHTAWPQRPHPRRAGVSGFGYGGTIAHLLLEQAPPSSAADGPDVAGAAGLAPGSAQSAAPGSASAAGAAASGSAGAASPAAAAGIAPRLFPLSTGSAETLRRHADALADWLTGPGADVPLAAVGHTLALRRSHLEHRAAVVADDHAGLAARLRHIARGEQAQGVASGVSPNSRGDHGRGAVWVFSGHGSQWSGMGRELLATEPAFAKVIDELEPVFLDEIGFSPREVLSSGELDTVDRAQTMIFAMQVGLAEVWRSYGVRPAAVIGHSVGEIAAAVVCGALDLADGARLICRRSLLLRRVAGSGAMAMASISFAEAAERLGDRTDVVPAISASPVSTVIAGSPEAVAEVTAQWQADGVHLRRVNSDVAFHSPHMDALCGDLAAAAAALPFRAPAVPMYRTSLAVPRSDAPLDSAYWAGNLRNPVRLVDAVTAAAEDGHRAFLEVSGHPVVQHSVGETLADLGLDAAHVGYSLRRNHPEQATLLTNLGALHCHGVPVDWTRLQPPGSPVVLPPMPWQHRRHWLAETAGGRGDGAGHDIDAHTLLGAHTGVAGTGIGVWRTRLDDETRPYPGSHTIHGIEVVPAAVLLTTFLATARRSVRLTDVELQVPLPTADSRELQVVDEAGALRLASRAAGGNAADDADGRAAAWVLHASAQVSDDAGEPLADTGSLRLLRPADAANMTPVDPAASADGAAQPADAVTSAAAPASVDPALVIDHLASVGVPSMAFHWTVTQLAHTDGRLSADVTVEQPSRAPATWGPVFDAALSAAPAAFAGPAVLRVVAGVGEVRVGGEPPSRVLIDVAVDPAREDTADVTVADGSGQVVARLTGVRFGRLDLDRPAPATPRQLVHRIGWPDFTPAPDGSRPPTEVVLVAADTDLGAAIEHRLTAAGLPTRTVADPDELARLAPPPAATGAVLVLPPAPAPANGATELPLPTGQSAAAEDGRLADRAAQGGWLLTRTVQVLAGSDGPEFPRLWCVTRGVREAAAPAALADAPLWGLGRILATEHPELWGGVIDLAPGDRRALDAVPGLLAHTVPDDVLAPRADRVAVARLTPLDQPSDGPAPAERPELRCRPDASYLVTGGLGVLGLDIADWLADRGARRIVLASRSGLPPRSGWDTAGSDRDTLGRIARIRALEARGVTVRVLALDVTDLAAARAALDPDALGLPPIRGVVHAAGVLDNRFAVHVDEASLRGVLRPKVDGAWVLHRLFPVGTLDFLTLFSSCGHLLGLAGQAAYGAANAFLDALATHRNAAADSVATADTTSFGWTSWRGRGMAVNEVVENELRARGIAAVDASEAFAAWEFAHRYAGGGHLPVLRRLPAGADTERPPLLRDLVDEDDGPAGASGPSGAAPSFAALPPEELPAAVQAEVGAQIAAEMRLPASELDHRRSLVEQGLDSVMTLVIRRRLEKRFGRALPATLLWNQPSVLGITEHLVGVLGGGSAPSA